MNRPHVVVDFPVHNPPGCDFCSVKIPAVREFPCRDFVMSAITIDGVVNLQNSIGNWMACAACATLIDSNDRTALVLRALDNIPDDDLRRLVKDDTKTRYYITGCIVTSHDGFFTNRYT